MAERRFGDLTSYAEALFTSGAYYGVLSFCLGQTEHCLAIGAFAIHVCFAVAVFISHKLEEAAEFFVFKSAFLNVS